MTTNIHRTSLSLALALLLPAPAAAQHFPSDAELTSLIQGRVDEGRATGIVLGVLEADGSTRIVFAGEPGPGARPFGESSVFEIGSITKVFTGILLADMVGRGEVALADPVASHLPEGVGVPSRGGRAITLLDLATHRSGLPRLPTNMAPADASNPYADYTVDQLYRFLSGYELPRDIGSEFEYSNLAVGLLGQVLSGVAGTSYEELVRARILVPLGMEMSGIHLTPEMRAWMVSGHDQGGSVVPLWDLPTLAGAGALRSNMRDMLKFLKANLADPGTELERAMRVSHEVRAEAGPGMSAGLNWMIRQVGEARIVWHNGGTAGFRTFIGFDPDRKVGVVVLTNSAHGADDIGFHLVNPAVALAPPPAAPPQRIQVDVAGEVLDDYVGEYQLAPTFSIVVTLEEGALFIQATGQGKLPLFPESETEFFLRAVEAEITFQRDETGAVTGLVLHQGGQNVPGRRVR